MNDANDMTKTLYVSNGRLVDTDGNPLSRLRPVFAFGCDYKVTLSLAEPLPPDVTRLVAMLDTDFDFSGKAEVCALAEFSPDIMTFSMGTRTRRFAEVISGRSSSVGYLQIDAIHEDGTTTRVLLDRVILRGVVADSSESYAVASVKGLEISANGTWVIDGVDTGQPARGVPGVSPSAKVSVDEKGNVILTVTDASGTTEQVISTDKAAQDSLIKRIEQAESEVASLKESKTDRTEHDELESRVELVESGVSSLESSKADRESTLAGYGITDAYTKSETDVMLDAKADKATTYTKTETNSLLDAKADKSTTLAGYGIADAYTKSEVDAKVTSVYRYKGTVSTYADLPSSGQQVGDVYNVETADSTHGIKAGDNVAWNGTTWDVLAGEIDLTPFALKADAATDHNHDSQYLKRMGGQVTGSISATGHVFAADYISTNGQLSGKTVVATDGIQQGISVIPATTTACTLSEGVYSHIPDSAPTYTLPAVADTGRTHEIVLNVRFGGTALSYSFEDTSGNSVTPLSTPSVEDGTVISFLCRYEPLLEQWAIMPVSLGRREVTA